MREQAELILRGQVLTVEASMPRAEALAISGGRILGAGLAAEVEALRGPATRVVNLGDACVMPGFIEAHTYRWLEHCGPDDDGHLGYRTAEAVAQGRARCPLAALQRRMQQAGALDEREAAAFEQAIAQEIEHAFAFALTSPYPNADDLARHLYA